MENTKKIVVLNWKEFGNTALAEKFLSELFKYDNFSKLNWIYCPPVIIISDCVKFLREKFSENFLSIGSQAIDYGNGTGKIRGSCLASTRCEYAMCGHAERGETDLIAEIAECAANSIKPIVLLKKLQPLDLPAGAIVVYEPQEAIGRGRAMELGEIEYFSVAARELYGAPILYGGSVDESNCKEISAITNGLCIGKASRESNRVQRIAELISETI